MIPVVGILWDRNTFNPLINTAEVASLFDAPLEMFLKVSKSINSLSCLRVSSPVALTNTYWLI